MNYYKISALASSQLGNHEGFVQLSKFASNSKRILDVGCGEGTRLNLITPPSSKAYGIDPSEKALSIARKKYPKLNLKNASGENIPFPENYFDLVYSAFTIEHCLDPKNFILEMIRVCKPNGQIIILAPNYGAPNRRSPNSVQDPIQKFIDGLIKDFFPLPNLSWIQVTPQKKYNQIDADTTWEPYLYSLLNFFKSQGLYIDNYSSMWSLEPETSNIRKKITKLLGIINIWPIKYWGPQIFVSVKKVFIPQLKTK